METVTIVTTGKKLKTFSLVERAEKYLEKVILNSTSVTMVNVLPTKRCLWNRIRL